MPPWPSWRRILYRPAKVEPIARRTGWGGSGQSDAVGRATPGTGGLAPRMESSEPHWGQRRKRATSSGATLNDAWQWGFGHWTRSADIGPASGLGVSFAGRGE